MYMKTSTLERKPNTLSQRGTLQTSSGLSHGKVKLVKHASVGSSRRVGDKAEYQVSHVLEQAGLRVDQTRNSGALKYDGDMIIKLSNVDGDYIRAECKHRNTSGFTVAKAHWNDIKKKANSHGGLPALVVHNQDGESMIVMDLKHFSTIIGAKDVQR